MNEEVKKSSEKSILNSVLEAAKNRLGSPIFGSFAIIWIIVNWKFVLVLAFGREEIALRIETVIRNYAGWEHMVEFPLFYTVAYLLGSRPLYEFFELWERLISYGFLAMNVHIDGLDVKSRKKLARNQFLREALVYPDVDGKLIQKAADDLARLELEGEKLKELKDELEKQRAVCIAEKDQLKMLRSELDASLKKHQHSVDAEAKAVLLNPNRLKAILSAETVENRRAALQSITRVASALQGLQQ